MLESDPSPAVRNDRQGGGTHPHPGAARSRCRSDAARALPRQRRLPYLPGSGRSALAVGRRTRRRSHDRRSPRRGGVGASPPMVRGAAALVRFALVVLATKQAGPRSPRATRLLERLGNVVLLERPINAETLTSAVRSALRGRRRQYQSRSLLFEQQRDRRGSARLERDAGAKCKRAHARARKRPRDPGFCARLCRDGLLGPRPRFERNSSFTAA